MHGLKTTNFLPASPSNSTAVRSLRHARRGNESQAGALRGGFDPPLQIQKQLGHKKSQRGAMLAVFDDSGPKKCGRVVRATGERRQKERNPPGILAEAFPMALQQFLFLGSHDRVV